MTALNQYYFDAEIQRLGMGCEDNQQGPCNGVCCQLAEGPNRNESLPVGVVRFYDDYQGVVLPVESAQSVLAKLSDDCDSDEFWEEISKFPEAR